MKVPESAVRVLDKDASSFYLAVDISENVPLGSRIDVDICEGDDRAVTSFTPQDGALAIPMDSPDYDVFIYSRVTSPINSVNGSVSYVCRPIAASPTTYTITQQGAVYLYTFSGVYRNYICLLAPRTGRQVITYDLDSDVIQKRALTYSLQTVATNGMATPILGNPHIAVYLNGYRLVPDIDYTYSPNLVNTSTIVSTDLVISNQRYLNLDGSGNLLEVVIDSSIIVAHSVGYNRNNVFVRNWAPELWDPSVSRLFNCGVLVQNVVDQGDYLTTTDTIRDGSPFLSEWLLPLGVQTLLDGLDSNKDSDLRHRVDSWLVSGIPTPPAFIHLYDAYTLYSPYIATIINDVIAGTFTGVDDPSDTLFLAQFSAYDYLKGLDPVIGQQNPSIDRKLVDIAPHYADYTVTDSNQLRIVRRLISLVLTNQQPTFGVTYT